MWRSLVLCLTSVLIASAGFVFGWLLQDLRLGAMIATVIFTLFILAAIINILLVKKISTFDTILPIPIAIIWGGILILFTMGAEVFSFPALIGASFILTIALWFYQNGRFPKLGIIFPLIVYVYEMLPVNIPGPIDEYFALGGSTTALLLQYFFGQIRKDAQISALIEATPSTTLPQSQERKKQHKRTIAK